MSKRNVFATALLATLAFGFAASSAQAQTITSSYSGTFESTAIDSNADGLSASRQSIRLLDGPMGPSTMEGINELAITGQGACPNGNLGIQFTMVSSPATPAALVQRFERSGDLLFLNFTSGSACFDGTTSILFLSATGTIGGGTGALAGATGSITVAGQGTFLFFDGRDAFGPQAGTVTSNIVLP